MEEERPVLTKYLSWSTAREGMPMCTRNAFKKVVESYASSDPAAMAELSGARFENGRFVLKYCGFDVQAAYPQGEVSYFGPPPSPGGEITHNEKILLLQYLTKASGLPVRGQWLSFLELRGGQLHWLPFQKEALEPLAEAYNGRREEFLKRGRQHGGEPFDQGDAGLVVPVLPRLPLVFALWEGDEEFPPRTIILFDAVSETYLSTATLYVLGIQAMIRIWFPGDTRFEEVPSGDS